MIRIKKMLLALLVATGLFAIAQPATAQSKIGFVNAYDVLSRLPETKSADSVMTLFRTKLDTDNKNLQAELEKMSIKFNADSAKMTPVQKEAARKDLQPLYIKVINFNSEAQKALESKQQELLAPIQKRTMDIITQVATENGYTHVFNRDALLIVPPGDDLFPLIAKKFNLK